MGHRTNPNGITEWRGSSYGTTKKQLTEKGNMAQSCQNGFFDSGVIPEKYEPRIVPMGMENDNPGILPPGTHALFTSSVCLYQKLIKCGIRW